MIDEALFMLQVALFIISSPAAAGENDGPKG